MPVRDHRQQDGSVKERPSHSDVLGLGEQGMQPSVGFVRGGYMRTLARLDQFLFGIGIRRGFLGRLGDSRDLSATRVDRVVCRPAVRCLVHELSPRSAAASEDLLALPRPRNGALQVLHVRPALAGLFVLRNRRCTTKMSAICWSVSPHATAMPVSAMS